MAGGVLLLKSNKEYVLTFNILAQVLVGYHFYVCQLVQSRIVQAINSSSKLHRVPSLRDIMAGPNSRHERIYGRWSSFA
jgi:hypothetical protein